MAAEDLEDCALVEGLEDCALVEDQEWAVAVEAQEACVTSGQGAAVAWVLEVADPVAEPE